MSMTEEQRSIAYPDEWPAPRFHFGQRVCATSELGILSVVAMAYQARTHEWWYGALSVEEQAHFPYHFKEYQLRELDGAEG